VSLCVAREPKNPRTLGKTYTAPDGTTFRPSLFVTLTCPSYGRVDGGGVPADPVTYQYDRAARDALHFAALFDRFIQNLRRYLGYDLQNFAAIEPRRRLAPHVHIAMRGTVSRAEIRSGGTTSSSSPARSGRRWTRTTSRVRSRGYASGPGSVTGIRASCATREPRWCWPRGTPLHVVSEVLGRASIASTKDVYGHLLEGDKRAAAESMSRVPFSGC
jgi:hypothetical protein